MVRCTNIYSLYYFYYLIWSGVLIYSYIAYLWKLWYDIAIFAIVNEYNVHFLLQVSCSTCKYMQARRNGFNIGWRRLHLGGSGGMALRESFEFVSLGNIISCNLRRVFREILRLVKGSVTNRGGAAPPPPLWPLWGQVPPSLRPCIYVNIYIQ